MPSATVFAAAPVPARVAPTVRRPSQAGSPEPSTRTSATGTRAAQRRALGEPNREGQQRLALLERLGVAVTRPRHDIDREATFSVPGAPRAAVALDEVADPAQFASLVRGALAFSPRGGGRDGGSERVRIFCPGLNTPEPEASRRTQYYVDMLGLPMAHFHNGTQSTHASADSPEAWAPADRRDWLEGLAVRADLRLNRLVLGVEELLDLALRTSPPTALSLTFYSDATIAAQKGIERFIAREVDARLAAHHGDSEAAHAEVQNLLRQHVFIELHGNASARLPRGPRYLIWTDVNDPLTTTKVPVIGGSIGVHGGARGDNPDAVFIDYEGPFTDRGFDAHNLAASGIHVVCAVLRRNQVTTPEALWERAHAGEDIHVPVRTAVRGDAAELWNPGGTSAARGSGGNPAVLLRSLQGG